MRELSLNILDIAQNSIDANASLIAVSVSEQTKNQTLEITIKDNGKGMSPEQLEKARDPFYTTRTTRKVGMGVPLFKMAAEMTGGSFSINSVLGKGTETQAVFKTDNVDFTPLGDIKSTIIALVTMNTDRDFLFSLGRDEKEFVFDTREIKRLLGAVPLNEPEVVSWMNGYLGENINNLYGGVGKHENS